MNRNIISHMGLCLLFVGAASFWAADDCSAAIVVNNVFSSDMNAYAGSASNSDLINGLSSTSSGFFGSQGAPFLNNGVYAGFNFSEIAWVQDPGASAEFTLGTGSYGLGYDITSIHSTAAWNSADFRNQFFDVSVQYLGDAGFTFLAQVDNRPAQSGAAGATQSTVVEDETGLLASGVVAIRFDFFDAASNFTHGTTFSEIDVFGFDTMPAPEPATLAGLAGGLFLLAGRKKNRSPVKADV